MGRLGSVVLVIVLAAISLYGVYWLGERGDSKQPVVQAKTQQADAHYPASSQASLLDLSKVNPYDRLHLLKQGTFAPDFSALSASGESIKLDDFQGKRNLVLIFYQGYFCEVCGAQLEQFQSELDKIHSLDTEVIAISADGQVNAAKTVGERGLGFPVIPDPEKRLIADFGVANIKRNNIAFPSVYVLNKEGRVAKTFADPTGKRAKPDDILSVLKNL